MSFVPILAPHPGDAAEYAGYLEELPLVGRRPQPADVLERKPADTDGLDGRQVRVVGRIAGRVVAVD